eukprot:SAG31_NODE_1183_length_9510_cov_43.257040_8_plen_42_part_00
MTIANLIALPMQNGAAFEAAVATALPIFDRNEADTGCCEGN